MAMHELARLRDRTRVFRDRAQAGGVLADMMAPLQGERLSLLAVPAGGVPVAAALARALALPLDVAVVSKITPAWNTEVGYGAVTFDGHVALDEARVAQLGIDVHEQRAGVARTREKVQRRVRMLRPGRGPLALDGLAVVLVDDGLASGFTMRCAVGAARRAGAGAVIVAVPTGSLHAVERLVGLVDELYCANVRGGWSFAVADAYERWTDVGEGEALALLRELGG